MEPTSHTCLRNAMVSLRAELLRTARRFAPSAHDAEDLVHSAYQRALERIETIRHEDNLPGWLRRLVHNLAVDSCRRRPRMVPLMEMAPLAPAQVAAWRHLDEQEVHALLQGCRPELAETFALHFFERLSNPEIARRLQIPLPTVASRLHRVRERMRRVLATRPVDPPLFADAL